MTSRCLGHQDLADNQHMARPRSMFCSIAAQPDNLGDIVIRRVFLDWMDGAGLRLHVFIGDMPPTYVEAFDLPEDSRTYRSPGAFEIALLRGAVTRRAHLAFAPGPLGLLPGLGTWPKSLANLLNAVAVRLSGGRVLVLGRAVRGSACAARSIERLLARTATLCVVRDHETVAILRGPAMMAPDLAFSEPSTVLDDSPSRRDRLALSFRGDRPPPTDLVRSLAEQAIAIGLRPLLVTQVGSDHALHAALSADLGLEHLGWDEPSARDQLARVRSAYLTSAIVVSDRLHALILATTAGAVPIGATYGDSDKLQATLGAVIDLPLVDRESSRAPQRLLTDADASRPLLTSQLDVARARLESVRLDVVAVLND